jgi:hypothetical protein
MLTKSHPEITVDVFSGNSNNDAAANPPIGTPMPVMFRNTLPTIDISLPVRPMTTVVPQVEEYKCSKVQLSMVM